MKSESGSTAPMAPLVGNCKLDNQGEHLPSSGSGLIKNEVTVSQGQLISATIYLTRTSGLEAG